MVTLCFYKVIESLSHLLGCYQEILRGEGRGFRGRVSQKKSTHQETRAIGVKKQTRKVNFPTLHHLNILRKKKYLYTYLVLLEFLLFLHCGYYQLELIQYLLVY